MILTKLFETQKRLDDRIKKEKGLAGQDLLPEKILALQVELGELANEQRSWKFWSADRKPRTKIYTWIDGLGRVQESTDDPNWLVENQHFNALRIKNPLLEEYVDCLHFILSIGLELGCEDVRPAIRKTAVNFKGDELTVQFNEVMYRASGMAFVANKKTEYQALAGCFMGLGEMLGFTWEQIKIAYYDKNKINHERQASGY